MIPWRAPITLTRAGAPSSHLHRRPRRKPPSATTAVLDSTLSRSIPWGGGGRVRRAHVREQTPAFGQRIVVPRLHSLVAHGLKVVARLRRPPSRGTTPRMGCRLVERDRRRSRCILRKASAAQRFRCAVGDRIAHSFCRRADRGARARHRERRAELVRTTPPDSTTNTISPLPNSSGNPSGLRASRCSLARRLRISIHTSMLAIRLPVVSVRKPSQRSSSWATWRTTNDRRCGVLKRFLSCFRQPPPRSRAVHEVVGETFHKHLIPRFVSVRLEELRQPFDVHFTQRHVSEWLGDVPLEGVRVRLSESAAVADCPAIDPAPPTVRGMRLPRKAFGIRSVQARSQASSRAGDRTRVPYGRRRCACGRPRAPTMRGNSSRKGVSSASVEIRARSFCRALSEQLRRKWLQRPR